MCGIAGIIANEGLDEQLVERMTRSLTHRGPDDSGIWVDHEVGVGLGHRRLSIVDLSPAGHQPMVSADDRYVLSFNGEIYNHQEIRADLEATGQVPDGGWKGHSDTEVLLQAIATWGRATAVQKAAGMFAIALWDRKDRVLTLARDRFGEKPLYFGWIGRDFVFGSELKALRVHPKFANDIDRNALRDLVSRTYIPAPLSIYRGIFKLCPGHMLTVPLQAARIPLSEPPRGSINGPRLDAYWSYDNVLQAGLDDPIVDGAEALEELDAALSRAVASQSVADVPVGMFLSGGIDSSLVTALFQRNSSRSVRTFSIGFEDPTYNEAPFARRVAERLGTIHEEQILTDADALNAIPLLPTIYDEPFADSSQIPTYLVSRMARSQVTVALTGDGGDELFGGYYRHFYAPQMWRQVRRVPRVLRAGLGGPLSMVPSSVWSHAGALLPGHGRANIGAKIQKGIKVSARAREIDDVYASFLDEWSCEASPVLGANAPSDRFKLSLQNSAPDELRMMYCDAVSYLPGDILCKVDRASMAVSLETRLPFLDHRVAAIAARIPLRLKIADGEGKRILRKLLYAEAPRELFERPKAGFAIPLGAWLRGPLRDWAEALLDERQLASQGWLDPKIVRARWREHLSGRRDSPSAIWALLMFQAWLDEQGAQSSHAQEVRPLMSRAQGAGDGTSKRSLVSRGIEG